MKKIMIIITLLLSLITVTGCWDSRELEQRTSVVAVGIDRSEKNKKAYRITIQVPIPLRIMGGATGEKGQEAIRVMSAEGHSLHEAIVHLQRRVNQVLFFGHTRIVVISEEVAREGTHKILDPFRRSPQIRRLLWPMVVKGSSRELLMSNSKLEQIPTIYIMDLLKNGAAQGLIPNITLGQYFIDDSDGSTEPAMNYVQSNRQEFKWDGLALFKDDRMIGVLTDQEVWSLLHLRDQKIAGEIEAPCPDRKQGEKRKLVTYRPKTIKVKKSFQPKGTNNYRANFHVRLEGDIIESQCNIDFTKPENLAALQKSLSRIMTVRAGHLISKLQQGYKTDHLKVGSLARATHSDWWRRETWTEIFPKGEIQAKYDVFIRRTGMEMK